MFDISARSSCWEYIKGRNLEHITIFITTPNYDLDQVIPSTQTHLVKEDIIQNKMRSKLQYYLHLFKVAVDVVLRAEKFVQQTFWSAMCFKALYQICLGFFCVLGWKHVLKSLQIISRHITFFLF